MSEASETELRYPVGKFRRPESVNAEELRSWINEIAALPSKLSRAITGLNEQQLNTPYRPGGWTVRQVVHHLADSHVNSYMRFRLALTEDSPRITAYNETAWAELPDARTGAVSSSLELLSALHARWTSLLSAMTPEQFARTFEHSENGSTRLDVATALYAWHGRHHTGHIDALRRRENW